jgi:defect-in-organelle-trafficking protein DotC
MLRPPVVTEAQLAFALGAGGQTASETGHVYEITREAQLTSAPPNWRTYLVRTWVTPTAPPDDLRPRTKQEVQYWDLWVAQGWADGEKQAVEIFLADLSRLQGDIVGMARYRVLLRAGLVEQPRVAFARNTVEGGRDLMKIDNTTVRITDQPGLNPHPAQWRAGQGSPNGPISPTP